MSVFEEEVLSQVQLGREGKVMSIPLHLERTENVLTIRKKVYTLLGANSGAGKTSFCDNAYILEPYMWWQEHKDCTDIKFKGLYRSMERQRGLKLTKWACWRLYKQHGILMDAETLLGYRKTKVSDDVWSKLVACRDWADELLDYVEIIDGRCTPQELESWINSYALKNGVLFFADEYKVYQQGEFGVTTDVGTFADNGVLQTLRNGDVKSVVYFKNPYTGEDVSLGKFERIYMEKDGGLFTTIVLDHIAKLSGKGTLKDRIDKASEVMSDARDLYNFSPVAVSQFNRGIGDTQRIKLSGGELSPILEDFRDSANPVQDCDLALALFNPYRYRIYDEDGMYKGYNIKEKLMSNHGFNRYRLLSILKNSYGIDDVELHLKFLGEVGQFTTLPRASDELALQEAYDMIALNR